MSVTDELVANAQRYEASYDQAGLQLAPARGVAVVACMDARLNLYALLGIREGDAHIIRNAGGAVTSDVLRSLAISQRLLGTTEVILIHHTDCGMQTFREEEFKAAIEAETGLRPAWATETFSDLEADVLQSVGRVLADPFVPRKESVRGFIYEVESGALREVKTTRRDGATL